MPATLSIEVEGLDRLLRKLDVSRLDGHIRPMFQRVATLVEGNVRREAPRDTGALGRSIQNRLEGAGFDMTGRVFSTLTYALVMEHGRRPGGRMPPPQALAGWARRHGFAGSLFILARAIGRRGIRARHFMRTALDRSKSGIDGVVRRTARDIEGDFRR